MDSTQAIVVFLIETGIFLVILVGCLKLASNQHRKQLLNILKETKAAKTTELNQKNNQALVSELNHQIASLQQDLLGYSNLKKYHQKVSSEYQKLLNVVESAKTTEVGSSIDRYKTSSTKHNINYLPNEKELASYSNSLNNATNHVISLVQYIREQQSSIEKLSNLEGSNHVINIEKKTASSKNVEELQSLLDESQQNNKELQRTIDNLKKRIESAAKNISSDNQNGIEFEKNWSSTNSNENAINNVNEADFSDLENPLYEYHKIKQEVLILRENTAKQRALIFSLEEQIHKLKNNFDPSSMPTKERDNYYEQIAKLERLIKESEICIEVLESEVTFLQDKMAAFSHLDDNAPAQPEKPDPSTKIEQLESSIEVASKIREKLRQIIWLALSEDPQKAIEAAKTHILEAFEPINVDVIVKITTQFGESQVSTFSPISKEQQEMFASVIRKGSKSIENTEDGFIVSDKKISVYIKANPSEETSLGKLQDTIGFITLVSNTVLTLIDDNQTNKTRLIALKRLVNGVRKKISNVSVQAKYQRDEAQLIFNSLIKELNNCLNTMNITENQSIFFEQMLSEAKARMDILLQSDVVVDKSFADLLDNIEDSTKHIN